MDTKTNLLDELGAYALMVGCVTVIVGSIAFALCFLEAYVISSGLVPVETSYWLETHMAETLFITVGPGAVLATLGILVLSREEIKQTIVFLSCHHTTLGADCACTKCGIVIHTWAADNSGICTKCGAKCKHPRLFTEKSEYMNFDECYVVEKCPTCGYTYEGYRSYKPYT